jgi:hypothetical protein
VIYNASAAKIYNGMSRVVRFEKQTVSSTDIVNLEVVGLASGTNLYNWKKLYPSRNLRARFRRKRPLAI